MLRCSLTEPGGESKVGTSFHVGLRIPAMYPPALRTLDIVALLSEAPYGMPLSTIATTLALPKSAAHRLLAGLCDRGYARQLPENHHYALTFKLAALGFRQLAATRVDEVCQPVLDRLAASSGELARLAVVEGERMTWVAKAQGTLSGLRYDAHTGREVVLHATAVGKIWLASLPEDRVLAIIGSVGIGNVEGLGPRALRTLGELREQLRESRRRGYGVAVEEGEPGVAAVAAAVRASSAADAPVVATISVAGPVGRMDESRREALGREVVGGAEELSEIWPVRVRHRQAEGREDGIEQREDLANVR